MPDDFGWLRWAREFAAASQLADRQALNGPLIGEWMREVGFVDVRETVFMIPLNGWPKDTRFKHVGMLWQRNMLDGLSAFSLGMFSRFLGKTAEEIEVSFVGVCWWIGAGVALLTGGVVVFSGGRPEEPL